MRFEAIRCDALDSELRRKRILGASCAQSIGRSSVDVTAIRRCYVAGVSEVGGKESLEVRLEGRSAGRHGEARRWRFVRAECDSPRGEAKRRKECREARLTTRDWRVSTRSELLYGVTVGTTEHYCVQHSSTLDAGGQMFQFPAESSTCSLQQTESNHSAFGDPDLFCAPPCDRDLSLALPSLARGDPSRRRQKVNQRASRPMRVGVRPVLIRFTRTSNEGYP